MHIQRRQQRIDSLEATVLAASAQQTSMEQQLAAVRSEAASRLLEAQQAAEAHRVLLAEHVPLQQALHAAQQREEVGGSPSAVPNLHQEKI